MRGALQPSVTSTPSETQKAFRALSRHRRTKIATAAKTTLVKADQWGRGDAVTTDVSAALDHAVAAFQKKNAKKG
jgi:hypothetical protein